MRLLFDIESDGLLDTITKIHCICAIDVDTGEEFSFHGSDRIDEGLLLLSSAEQLIGHNILGFDIPAIKLLYPDWECTENQIDTLVYARLVYHNRVDRDYRAIRSHKTRLTYDNFMVWNSRYKSMQSAVGRHSLESYGLRLGFQKDNFGHDADWSTFTPEMLSYCQQDVRVNWKLLEALEYNNYSQDAVKLEMETAKIINDQVSTGWEFDRERAEDLYGDLIILRKGLRDELQGIFKGWHKDTKTPEYYEVDFEDELGNKIHLKADTKGILKKEIRSWKNSTITSLTLKSIEEQIVAGPVKRVHTEFNGGSADHVYLVLKEKYDWTPTVFNEKDGKPTVDDDVLKSLEYPEVPLIQRYRLICGHIAKLAEGTGGGYLGYCDDKGRIHGKLDPLGTNTMRAKHHQPQLGQVPSPKMEFGKELRSLFTVPEGYKLVGTDASQQEMACMAHYLAPWDDGEFAIAVSSGSKEEGTDPHTLNQKKAGLASRDETKTCYYAVIYGSGAKGLAETLGMPVKRAAGIRESFLNGVTGLNELIEQCKEAHKKNKCIKSLDGRLIYTRSEHSALNALFQSTGAILCKRWMVIIRDMCKEQGISEYVQQVIWVHDELQYQVKEEYAEQLAVICKEAMKEVEEYYQFNCPLDADSAIGDNWGQTH